MYHFVILTCTSAVLVGSVFADCKFSVNGNTPTTALVLKHQTKPAFLYPDDYNNIHLAKGGVAKLQCLDKKFKRFKTNVLWATCLHDDVVRTKSEEVKFGELECEDFPASRARKTSRECYGNKTLIEIGFKFGMKFLKTIDVCFDEQEARALYSWYELPSAHLGHQSGIRRPSFVDTGIHDFEVDQKYARRNQLDSFAKILKSKSLARRYVRSDNLYFLARGHLTPKADFLYGIEQASSFHYVNVAPQWQIFNGGNWQKLEVDVRDLLMRNGNHYGVVTGTYGISTLPDVHGEEQKLYLYVDGDDKRLPVPKFFWKIVYHRHSQKGVAVVGVNNPHLKEIPKSYILCEDICSSVKWLTIKSRKDIKRGFTYCCDMRKFLEATGFENVFK